jgi:diguanylate cyclase (GGDEF)-like protein
MKRACSSAPDPTGRHFSCAMTSILVERVRDFGGEDAVDRMLALAGSPRSAEYLLDPSSWVCYDEALALWQSGARITQHPQFARAVGEDAARRLNASPVAALLRSLGSPENVYRQIATTSTKYSVVTTLEAVAVGPGFAEIVARAVDGFPRVADHCAWTCGLLSQPTILFGFPQATVTHDRCAALGAAECRYTVTWEEREATDGSASSVELEALREQLAAVQRRLHSIFQTAGDLIAADEIEGALARITDRAALEVRAQRYLLAVRLEEEGGKLLCHRRGFEEDEGREVAERILTEHPAALPDNWLVVPVRSGRRDYGRLLAMYEDGRGFFPQERELLEVYARYAASALDSATALIDARRRYEQSSALLSLARALAVAGTSEEVARKLCDAVPSVVDCDRVGVYLWDAGRGELVRRAMTNRLQPADGEREEAGEWRRAPVPGGLIERLIADPNAEPMFIDADTGEPTARQMFASIGAVATLLVPLVTTDSFLGVLAASVMDGRERLAPSADLLDRLSGVAAQATTALQNGRLVDQITHQALHDDLTGLANRLRFQDALRHAIGNARGTDQPVTLFYLDLDSFKPVNDTFGHAAGDRLLVAVGERLRRFTRPGDIVARLGGDEFAVLIGAPLSAAEADALELRLAEAFSEPFAIDGAQLRIGASVGRATFPDEAANAEDLMRRADVAMFADKRAHRELLAARAA